jgi:hypothetical protein
MAMDMMHHHKIHQLIMELNELVVVYGYMIQNAPTEEARRLIELNRKTVMNTRTGLLKLHKDLLGEELTDLGEAMEEVPVFPDFRNAAQYAFIEESQIVQMLKNLYLAIESCHHNTVFNYLIEHEVNAMRLLYLLT